MTFAFHCSSRLKRTAAAALCLVFAGPDASLASEFSVTPIRAELKAGSLNETLTVTNYAATRLRVSIKLMEWTQDAAGADVYRDSSDLVYFPRQMEIAPDSKRLVRIGAKTPGALVERAYRLFIEEEPEATNDPTRAQVAIYFRFGVPVFVPPAVAKARPDVAEPTLSRGKLALVVKNSGNQHFRLTKVSISDGAGYLNEIQGWYSLAGSERTYSADIPKQVCQQAKALSVTLEGDGIRIDRKLNVDPPSCL